MKKLIFILCIALGLMTLSCQTEDALLTNSETNLSLQIDELDSGQTTNFEDQSRKGGGIDTPLFESRLQWMSFISAKLLRENTEHRNHFISLLGSGETIAADDLIGPGPFTSTFNVDFRDLLIYYIGWIVPDPDDELIIPDPAPSNSPLYGEDAETLADEIIDYLTLEHCVELYFPKGFDYTGWLPTITSTAHPLNADDSNDGIIRYYQKKYGPQYPIGTWTAAAVVDASYVASSANKVIIVARPYRLGPFESECQYSEYSGIDFEDFLDQ